MTVLPSTSSVLKRGLLCTAICVPFSLYAQSANETDRDRSAIVAFLEDNLSSDASDIRIDGFKGLLSSQASLERLTISDENGAWLTLENVDLDWKRTALLAGNLVVNSLEAESVTLERLPAAKESAATPEATPFSLPDLPVSVSLGTLDIEHITLGEDVLGIGEAVTLSLTGSARLEGGEGAAQIMIERLDDTMGMFHLDAAYDNGSNVLDLDLALEEGKGGFISTLIDLPGAPDLALTVQGSGPLDSFVSDIALSTLGQPRLTGQVSLTGVPLADGADPTDPKSRRFEAYLSGDITPLFDAEYATFFGSSSSLNVDGVSHPNGSLQLDKFSLGTQALALTGSASIGTDKLPTAFDVTGFVSNTPGTPTLLPLSGDKRFISSAAFTANYDVHKGETWQASAVLRDYSQADLEIASVQLEADGRIARRPDADTSTLLRSVQSQITAQVEGLNFGDPALQSAVGSSITANTNLHWHDGAPLSLQSLTVTAQDTQLTASGTMDGFDDGFEFTGNLGLSSENLSRFALISGTNISGAATVDVAGTITPLSGGFDLITSGTGRALRLGIEQADTLLTGQSSFEIAAVRDETGLTLKSADVRTTSVQAQASGALTSGAADLKVAARLDDVSRLGVDLSGPANIEGTVQRSTLTAPWQVNTSLTGPNGSQASVAGTMAQSFETAALQINGSAPLGLANSFTTAALLQGTLTMDLSLNGPLELASLAGALTTSPNTRIVVPAAGLSFAVERGSVALAGTTARLNAALRAQTGGLITAQGSVDLGPDLQTNIQTTIDNLNLTEANLYSTSVDGTLTVSGPALRSPQLTGKIEVGETEISVNPAALGAGGDILDVTHINEPATVKRTRARAGAVKTKEQSQGSAVSLGLDVTIDAPQQIYIRGRGLDAEMGGNIRLTGTTNNIIPVGEFSLIRGRLNILGKRLEMDEGQLNLQGSLDPTFSLIATTSTDDLDITVTTSGSLDNPEIEFSSSPDFPDDEILAQLLFGRSIANISAFQAAQLVSAAATLTGGGSELGGDIRGKLGLDNIDLTTSEDGDAALQVGKYISDEVYTDVTIDSTGRSIINLNLDATDNITLKGSFSTDNDTGLGVFFEKDY